MRLTEYKISEKSVLKRNTPFKANGGPYYVSEAGEHINMADRGPFVFLWAEENNGVTTIHALDKDGLHSPLHIKGERKSVVDGMVARPYKIKSRMIKNLHKVKGLTKQRRKK